MGAEELEAGRDLTLDLLRVDAVGVLLGALRARDSRRACWAVVAEGVEDERDRYRVVLDVAVVDLTTRTDRLDAGVAVVGLALQVWGRGPDDGVCRGGDNRKDLIPNGMERSFPRRGQR